MKLPSYVETTQNLHILKICLLLGHTSCWCETYYVTFIQLNPAYPCVSYDSRMVQLRNLTIFLKKRIDNILSPSIMCMTFDAF